MKLCKKIILYAGFFLLLSTPAYSQEILEYLGAITPKEKDLLREPSSIFVEKERVIISDKKGNDLKFYYFLQDNFVKLKGDEKQKISYPGDVKVSPDGNIVVADTGNSRILVLDRMGNLLFSFGSKGKEPGFFRNPEGLTIDSLGRIYVADTGNYRIQIFSKDGIFTKTFGKYGDKDNEFYSPTGISIYQDKFIFVIDSEKNSVIIFDMEGNFINKFGQEGKEFGQFQNPTKVDMDSSGNILVADPKNYRIQKFTPGGKFLTAIGSKGTGRGQFMEPKGIYIDSFDKIYVMDAQLKNIQIFKFTKPVAKKEEKGVFYLNPPSTPKGLKLSYGEGKITLSWDKNPEPDMDHYVIYKKDSKTNQLVETASTKENTYSDKDIKEGLTYSYGIKAVDAEKPPLSSPMSELQSVAAEIAGVTKKARVAVFTFKEASEKAKAGGFGDAIAEFLTTSLVNLTYFDVVEREQLKKIIEEQSLSQTGALESAQKLGEIMGIDVFIMGSVTLLGELVEIDSRLVDVATGRVITAQNVSAEGLPKVREAVKDMSNKIVTNYHLQLGSIWGAVKPHDTDINIVLEIGGKLYTSSKVDKQSGRFSFSGVLSGTYQMKVLTDKYDVVNLPPAIIIKSGQRTEIPEIELKTREAVQKPMPEIKIPVTPPPQPVEEKVIAKPPAVSVEIKPAALPAETLPIHRELVEPKAISSEPEPMQKTVTPSAPAVSEEKKPKIKEGPEVIETPESPQ
ncbi:MAG: hypothetical protein HY097_01270 [Nitrospinae bacterium]|nr:hypothetical protein [Nitrospinota bacterium]